MNHRKATVDILCSDKTGTLTQNNLTLGAPFCIDGITAEQVILNAALASRAENIDTIDLAVPGGLKNDQALRNYHVKTLQGYKLEDRNGETSNVDEFYFDDRYWTDRYLVADTGNWLTDIQVLISPNL